MVKPAAVGLGSGVLGAEEEEGEGKRRREDDDRGAGRGSGCAGLFSVSRKCFAGEVFRDMTAGGRISRGT